MKTTDIPVPDQYEIDEYGALTFAKWGSIALTAKQIEQLYEDSETIVKAWASAALAPPSS